MCVCFIYIYKYICVCVCVRMYVCITLFYSTLHSHIFVMVKTFKTF